MSLHNGTMDPLGHSVLNLDPIKNSYKKWLSSNKKGTIQSGWFWTLIFKVDCLLFVSTNNIWGALSLTSAEHKTGCIGNQTGLHNLQTTEALITMGNFGAARWQHIYQFARPKKGAGIGKRIKHVHWSNQENAQSHLASHSQCTIEIHCTHDVIPGQESDQAD